MNNHERLSYTPENFESNIQEVLSRRLTPETIDSYADTALEDLIVLSDRITTAYRKQPTIGYTEVNKDAEDAAFAYFKLDNLDMTLEHVAEVSDSIRTIDNVIAKARRIDTVIVPTDALSPLVKAGNGEYSDKKSENRLKSILFVLEHDFEVDIHDPSELKLTAGVEPNDMVRKSGYYMIEVPSLDRTVLV